jgi:hypothetical protein
VISYELEVRAIPLWLLGVYLQELGGKIQPVGNATREEVLMNGPGWQAVLRQMEDFHIGSLRVGQVYLKIEAEDAVLKALRPALEKKLLRAGG